MILSGSQSGKSERNEGPCPPPQVQAVLKANRPPGIFLSLFISTARAHDQTCICSFLDPFIASLLLPLPPALNALLCSFSLLHMDVKMISQNHRSRCHLPRGVPSPAGEHLTSWGCPAGTLVNVNPPIFPRHGPPFPGLWFSSSSLCGPVLLPFLYAVSYAWKTSFPVFLHPSTLAQALS